MKNKLLVVDICLLVITFILYILDIIISFEPEVEKAFSTAYLILGVTQALLLILAVQKDSKQ